MESISERRRLKSSTLVVGVLGIVVGVVGTLLLPNLRAQTPVNTHAKDGLTVTLHFKRGQNHTLELQGCSAFENDGKSRDCAGEKAIQREWNGQAFVEWNGENGGSGCTTVGNVRYCW